jgi:competence protein ComEA
MPLPDPLKSYRLYLAMFLLNLAVVVGVIYLLRRDEPRPILVTPPPAHPATAVSNKSATQITVAVSGAVNLPGPLELDSPARLADALQSAGIKPEADLSGLNLTQPLQEGDKISVPTRAVNTPAANALSGSVTTPSTNNLAGVTATPAVTTKLNLNTATLDDLNKLPGIGPTLAQRILDYRASKGRFTSIAEIKQVKGIGDVLFNNLKELITVQ